MNQPDPNANGMRLYPDVPPFLGARYLRSSGIQKLLLRLLPLRIALVLRTELQLATLRVLSWRVTIRYQSLRNALVNIGCGGRGRPGWINVDAFDAPGVTCRFDCRKRLPFPDGSCRGIFSEHFVEHLDYTEDIPFFIAECRRVLKDGGVLRIVVPDGERYLRAYCADGWTELRQLRSLSPPDYRDPNNGAAYHTKMELINEVFRQADQHRFAYDAETLCVLLERHRFQRVERSAFGRSIMPELCIDSPERADESLYVEAMK